MALAINEVAIKSSLGEALIAEIAITDVEKSPDIHCFSVTDSNASPTFTNTSLAIKHQVDGYQLIIKSHNAITEPILNLRVTHHCDPNINRDYVVLLDPPLQSDVKASAINTAATRDSAYIQNTASSLAIKIDSNTSSTRNSAKEKASTKKTVSKAANASSTDKKLTAMYTGQPQAAANTESRDGAALKSRPYLSISGGDSRLAESLTLPIPALRLETQIDLSRALDPQPLSNSDVMDEITAIDNRLALLRTQIISLQTTNEKLKSDAENSKMELEDSKRTLRIAAGLVALLAFLVFAEWMRRRLIQERLAKIKEIRLDDSDLASDPDHLIGLSINSTNKHSYDKGNSNFNDAFDGSSNYGVSSNFSSQPANTGAATNINSSAKEDILESADVLTEYGRFGLAIHLLQDYLADHPSESPKVWLKLLSLTASHGSETDYAQAVADCNNYYRIHMPSFAEAKKVGTATIEDFPYITKDLELAWGSAGALALLNDLIYNSESQPEDGFEPEIFEQLFMLKQIAENLNTDPSPTNAEAAQILTDANESNPKPDDAESTNRRSEPIMKVYETSPDALTESINDVPPQALPSTETFPEFNFDDYFSQDDSAQRTPEDNTASSADNHTLPESKPTLQAAEIDFPQLIKEAADTEDVTVKSAQTKSTPIIDGKPEKRVVKDSNLIDWVLTDET